MQIRNGDWVSFDVEDVEDVLNGQYLVWDRPGYQCGIVEGVTADGCLTVKPMNPPWVCFDGEKLFHARHVDVYPDQSPTVIPAEEALA